MFEDKDKREEMGNEEYPNEEYREEDIFAESDVEVPPFEEEEGQNTSEQEYSYMHKESRSSRRGSGNNRDDRPRRRHPYIAAIGCAVICGVIIGACVIGSFAIGRNMGTQTVSSEPVTVTTNEEKLETAAEAEESTQSSVEAEPVVASGEYTVAQIAEQCGSSVVSITNKSVQEVLTMFGAYEQESEGSGSGVIVGMTDDELLIATNYHVVEDADELTVCFFDSEDAVYSALIKGTDESNDLAVVAIPISDLQQELLDRISIATIGNSNELKVGDTVVAIGNALGLGQSVTSGIVSAMDRDVMIDDYVTNLIQTDAAINPGNSGGALFNMQGELVGINSAKYGSDMIEGMGFAIPTSIAQPVIENLMSQQTRTKLDANYGVLNITGTDVTSDVSQAYGMPVGVYVASVEEGKAAANAGIQTGDIITALDGVSVTTIEALRDRLQYYAAGETVDVTLERNGGNGYEEITVSVTLDNEADQVTASSGETEEEYGEEGGAYGYDGGEYYDYDDIYDFFNGNGNYGSGSY